jgi:hypothetical protein
VAAESGMAAALDRIRAIEQSAPPQYSRSCKIPNNLQFDRGTVFASKLVMNNDERRDHRAVPELFWNRVKSISQQETLQRVPRRKDSPYVCAMVDDLPPLEFR